MKAGFPGKPTRIALAVGTALSLASAQALAQQQAGRVLAASGTIVATGPGGGARALSSGSRVYTGDTIDTRDGRVQIRFIDGALVTLQPATRFAVEEYEFHDPAEGDPDEGGSVLMRLFSGALRTITGIIGDDEDEAYRMETPVATIGVRGTQYSLEMCTEGSCGDDVEDGLYGYVGDERVWARNDGGDDDFGDRRFFQVRNRNQKPVGILEPPGNVLRGAVAEEEDAEDIEDIDDPEAGGGDSQVTEGGAPAAGDDESLPQFSESEETGVAATSGINAAVAAARVGQGTLCNSPAECTAVVDASGNLVQLDSFSVDSDATLVDSGTVPALDATFGRWTGGSGGDFMWAYSGNPTSTAELSNVFAGASGTLSFSTFSGPKAVGDLGNVWDVSLLAVDMTFSGGTATVGLQDVRLSLSGLPGTINLENFNNTTMIDPGAGDLGFSIALEDGGATGSPDDGTLQALFVGDTADGLLVEFEVRDKDTNGLLLETIRGVQIVE